MTNDTSAGRIFVMSALTSFQSQKRLAERAIAQLADDQLRTPVAENTNSITVIMKHMAGNMLSRWTDFLTTDGEKPWRHRDNEFVDDIASRDELMALWERGWSCLICEVLKSMLRKTLTILSLIGLLLSVAAWVTPCSFGCRWGSTSAGVSSGAFGVVHWSNQQGWTVWGDWQEWGSITVLPYVRSGPFVAVPLWMPAVLFAAMCWWSVLPLHRRRKRRKLGLCMKCGYDLRASPDRCPECGQERQE